MKTFQLAFALFFISITGCTQKNPASKNSNKSSSQEKNVGGGCEGCEAVYESPIPFDQLNEVDTLPDFNEPGPKIEISGKIFKPDGKTPASGVVLYIYLPATERNRANPAGGNGVLKTEMRDGMLRAKRDIVLGLNVKGY